MKSNPQHRPQVNKQALKDETKEAARKQFSGAALSFTGKVFLFFLNSFCFYFLPVQQVRMAHNLASVWLKHRLKN